MRRKCRSIPKGAGELPIGVIIRVPPFPTRMVGGRTPKTIMAGMPRGNTVSIPQNYKWSRNPTRAELGSGLAFEPVLQGSPRTQPSNSSVRIPTAREPPGSPRRVGPDRVNKAPKTTHKMNSACSKSTQTASTEQKLEVRRLLASLDFAARTASDRLDRCSKRSRRIVLLSDDCAKGHPCRHGRVLCFGRAAR